MGEVWFVADWSVLVIPFISLFFYIIFKYNKEQTAEGEKVRRGAFWIGLVGPLLTFFWAGLYCLVAVLVYCLSVFAANKFKERYDIKHKVPQEKKVK